MPRLGPLIGKKRNNNNNNRKLRQDMWIDALEIIESADALGSLDSAQVPRKGGCGRINNFPPTSSREET